MVAMIDAIADAIPRHLPRNSNNPWGIVPGTLKIYNQAHGTAYTQSNMPGRDIAVWYLDRIDSELTSAGSQNGRVPTALEVVTGYLAGPSQLKREFRGQPFRAPKEKWVTMAKEIIADAMKSGMVPQADDGPTVTARFRKPRKKYTAKDAAIWGGTTLLTLFLIAKRKAKKGG